MPSIAQVPPVPLPIVKKRRRNYEEFSGADADMNVSCVEVQMKLTASPHRSGLQTSTLSHANHLISATSPERKYKIPRLHSKRARPNNMADRNGEDDFEVEKETDHCPVVERKLAKIDLSPCHICHRKPTEHRHLDAYADCESCLRRTCFICIRQCEGDAVGGFWMSSEHKERVCSRCCVERGVEGEVRCLGCLKAHDGD